MDETEVIYGTIGMLPSEEYNPNKQYEILNLVSHDGSSYVVHTKPPIGTLPTNLDYWQVSALGTSKATANSVGTVKPDGTTTEVSTDGSLSVKTATQNALGLVKGGNGTKVGTDGSVDVNTLFTQATELANIMAGEAFADVLGKISKLFATTMNLDQNALLKNMLTNMDANDQNKVPTSAFVHTLWARIGMGEDLDVGANLTAAVKALNSNLVKAVLITVDITTQATAGVALGASAYQQVITSDGVLAGKTIVGACVESVRNKVVGSEVGIGAIDTSNGYVYINTAAAGTYSVRVRFYYK